MSYICLTYYTDPNLDNEINVMMLYKLLPMKTMRRVLFVWCPQVRNYSVITQR